MSSTTQDRYFSGQGNLTIGRVDTTTGKPLGLRFLGNAPELKLSMAITNLEHKEARTGQRSTDKRLATETKVGASFKLENFVKENLALVMRGSFTDIVAGSVTDEATKFYSGAMMPLAHLGVSAVVVRKGVAVLVAYVDDDTDWDYKVNTAMGHLEFNTIADADTAGLVDGDDLEVDYSFTGQVEIESLNSANYDYFLRFEGLNTADENKPVIVEVFRFAGDPLKELSLISDTLATFDMEGSVYPSSKQPSGKSPYYRIIMVD